MIFFGSQVAHLLLLLPVLNSASVVERLPAPHYHEKLNGDPDG